MSHQARLFTSKSGAYLFLGLIHLDIGSGQRSKVEVALVLPASAADCKR